MLIHPQLFNYKIIIGSLIFGITAISVLGFSTYQSIKAEQQFLKQENKLVENELSKMIQIYDKTKVANQMLSEQLDSIKTSSQMALDKIRIMENDVESLASFRSNLITEKSRSTSLLKAIDSINLRNGQLENEKFMAYTVLDDQKKVNAALLKTNESLNKSIEKAAMMTVNSFHTKFYKSGTHDNETTKASQTKCMDVCFTLAKNEWAKNGMKEIYIQVLNPLNNVIGKKNAVRFDKSLLIYSDKQLVDYNNEDLNICATIEPEKNEKPFTKGTYYISVFHNDHKLGSTQIVLN